MAKLAHQCPTPFPSTQSPVRYGCPRILTEGQHAHDRWQYNSEPFAHGLLDTATLDVVLLEPGQPMMRWGCFNNYAGPKLQSTREALAEDCRYSSIRISPADCCGRCVLHQARLHDMVASSVQRERGSQWSPERIPAQKLSTFCGDHHTNRFGPGAVLSGRAV